MLSKCWIKYFPRWKIIRNLNSRYFKKNNKFGIAGRPRPSGILKNWNEKKWRWEVSTFYLKQLQLAKFGQKNSILLIMKMQLLFLFLLKNWILKLYFPLPLDIVYMSPGKISVSNNVFLINQLENNYTLHINGFCHSTKELLNWIALSINFLRGK